MEVRSVVVSVRKRAPRSAIALLAKNYCAVTVLTHTNCFERVPFKDTTVTAVKQFQAVDYEALLKRQSFCPQPYHEREVTRFFCLECQICVCQVCINTDHKNHNVDPLEKAADAEKANIMAAVESIERKKKVCSNAIKTFQKVVVGLEIPKFLNDDELLVAEMLDRQIKQFNIQTGNFVKNFGKGGTRDGKFTAANGISISDEGHVFVAL